MTNDVDIYCLINGDTRLNGYKVHSCSNNLFQYYPSITISTSLRFLNPNTEIKTIEVFTIGGEMIASIDFTYFEKLPILRELNNSMYGFKFEEMKKERDFQNV